MPRRKALYQVITDDIIRQIVSGVLVKGVRLPSEQDLIEKHNVSRITARRALQELEADDLIYRIKGSGSYVTGVFPRGTETYGVDRKIVALALPFRSGLGGGFDLIRGASDYLGANGYLLTVEHTTSMLKERQFLLSLASSPLSGFLFYPNMGEANLDVILQIDTAVVPIIIIDKYFAGTNLTSVVPDNYAGSRSLVEYLVSLGHREIAFVTSIGLNQASSVKDRYRGYCDGLRGAGFGVSMENVVIARPQNEEGPSPRAYEDLIACEHIDSVAESLIVELIRPLFDRQHPITAIVALDDYLAINIVRTLGKLGLKTPEDVSVVGFDNIELSSHVEVPLTTVAQNFYEIGITAARMLHRRLSGEHGTDGAIELIPTELIARRSTTDIGPGLRSRLATSEAVSIKK